MMDPLVILLQAPACQPLLAGLRRRIERGQSLAGRLRLPSLAPERRAIQDLTGQDLRGPRASLDLDAFAQVVCNTQRFASLLELVERATGGPIEDKSATRKRHSAQWDELWRWAAGDTDEPWRLSWLAQLRSSGWLKARTRGDRAAAEQMLAKAIAILARLPADGVPLPVFASTHLGDAHALDPNRDLARLVYRAIAAQFRLPVPLGRREIRRTWEAVGIVPDEISVTVLALNVPAIGRSLTDEVLRAHAALGEPCRLSFRHLRLHSPQLGPSGESPLFVCENPSIVAFAAERLATHCRPLICVEGQPNFAAWRLLKLVTTGGWSLYYHGDFDWGGLRIANQIHRELGFTPWRFRAANYRQAPGNGRQLGPTAVAALWDPDLAPAMLADGHALEEEKVVEVILQDLDVRNT